MRIALLGYGKMNRLIHKMALDKGHEVVLIDRHQHPAEINHRLSSSDAAIDFSHGDAVSGHVELCILNNVNLIVGTTNWDSHYEAIKSSVLKSTIGLLYSPNFAIGVGLFKQIVAHAAQLLALDYDVCGIEYHHSEKVDAPSGTAKFLTTEVLKANPTLKTLNFSSVRCGQIPGTHTLLFNSPFDTITLTHQAHNRDAFARGAIKAAEWMTDKKGFFSLEDYLRSVSHAI